MNKKVLSPGHKTLNAHQLSTFKHLFECKHSKQEAINEGSSAYTKFNKELVN